MKWPLAGAILFLGIDRGTRDMTVVGRVTEGHIELVDTWERIDPISAATAQLVVRLRDMPCIEPVLRVEPDERFSPDPWRRRGKRRGRAGR